MRKCDLTITHGTVKLGAIPVIGRKDAKGRLWIADIDQLSTNEIPVCGVNMKARIVVKIYCKPTRPEEKMAVEILHREKKRIKR